MRGPSPRPLGSVVSPRKGAAAGGAGATAEIERVRRSFARWAPWYDATHRWLPGRTEAVEALALRPGDRVLDIACGTGISLTLLQRLVGPSGEVVGLDLSAAMLSRARRRVARGRWTNVRLEEGDAAHLPFKDASFDAVLCAYALNIIPDLQSALAEVRRVLRPGGRFVAVDAAMGRLKPRSRALPCAVRAGRDLVREIRAVFGSSDVRTRWRGRIHIQVAGRGPALVLP